jgi:hypothetical protein
MAVTEPNFMKRVFAQYFLLKNFCTLLQENPTQSSVADDKSQTDRRTDEETDVVSIQDAFVLLLKRHLKRRCKSLHSQINSLYNKRYVPPQMQWPVQSPLWWIFQSCVSPSLTLLSPAISQPYILFNISLCPCNICTVCPHMTLHCMWLEIKVPDLLAREKVFYYCWYISKNKLTNFSFKI